MEHLTLKITSTIPVRIFAEELQAIRERNDAAARAGFFRPRAVQPAATGVLPVTMKELAARVGMDRSACRKYVLRLGYKPLKQRTADSDYQQALTVTAQEARAIQAQRASEGYCNPP